jgi:ketosteroid isomerase-like protein
MMSLSAVPLGVWNVAGKIKYSDGTRSRKEISGAVGANFAYLVQRETIHSRLAGSAEYSVQELRSTMVFRREADGWRILHRHADSLVASQPV